MKQVEIGSGDGTYSPVVGSAVLGLAACQIRQKTKGSSAFVVVDSNLPDAFVDPFFSALEAEGVSYHSMKIVASEDGKILACYETICGWLLDNGAERTSSIVALGGGIVGDIAGFVASTYQRGIPWFQVPTTLLAMVDSSIGGKVAVNFQGMKNFLGSFYQPDAVYADIQALLSLDVRQLRCGLAECIKHAILSGEELFSWTMQNMQRFFQRDVDALIELVRRNVEYKVGIARQDPTEKSVRILLNLGHTFGHVIEKYDVKRTLCHGEAVSIGVVAAGHLAQSVGLADQQLLCRIESAFDQTGLPIRLNLDIGIEEFIGEMKKDKKSTFTKLRLILPRSIGDVVVRDDIGESDIAESLKYIMNAPVISSK